MNASQIEHDLLPWFVATQLPETHRAIVQDVIDERDWLRQRAKALAAEVDRLTQLA